MERKHAACFLPATIEVWKLEPIATQVREIWERVNLYSASRGLNRFAALLLVFELLAGSPEARRMGFPLPDVTSLRERVRAGETSIKPIRAAAAREQSAFLNQVVEWSQRINRYVAERIQPRAFDGVQQFLKKASRHAHVVVVSSATTATLESEWKACGLAPYVEAVCGQEHGSKTAVLKELNDLGFARKTRLMIGDAPGDAEAAEAAGYAFYPIIPRRETASWQALNERSWSAFLDGTYSAYEEPRLRDQFNQALPSII